MTEGQWLNSTDPHAMLEFLRASRRASDRRLRHFLAACCRRVYHLLPADLLRDEAGRQAVEVAEQWADNPAEAGECCKAFVAVMIAARCEIRLFREPIVASTLHRPLPALLVLAVALRTPGDGSHLWDGTTEAAVLGGEEDTDLVQQALGASKYAADAVASDAVRSSRAQRPLLARLFNLTPRPARAVGEQAREEELHRHAGLVRCIFGNPFRAIVAAPSWLTCNGGLAGQLAHAAYEHRLLPSGHLDRARLAVLCDALLDAGCLPDHELPAHFRSPGCHVRGCFAVDAILGRE
jgi:hypothetical protein